MSQKEAFSKLFSLMEEEGVCSYFQLVGEVSIKILEIRSKVKELLKETWTGRTIYLVKKLCET